MNLSGIKALSIRQPWASLIADGFKDVENRDWKYPPSYRGYILIHASKTFDVQAPSFIENNFVTQSSVSENPDDYLRGGFIGLCRLNDVVRADDSPWFFGPLGFKIRMPKRIEFIPYRGQLGLWDVPDEIIKVIKIQEVA